MKNMKQTYFKIEGEQGHARAATLQTSRGVIKTPVFMPVGTKASVKAMFPEELEQMGAQIILGNTYHLHLRPGEKIIKNLGGLHKFMNWKGPILTDSGGFQIFSLAKLNKVSEEGVKFSSHIDGSTYFITPEKSMEIQMDLGSDIIMALDECLPHPSPREKIEKSMAMTKRWLERCKQSMTRKESLLFGIVQGGLEPDLRLKSMEQVCSIDLPGYAMGGFSVGEPIELMHKLVKEVAHKMPAQKPRYLMGVGTPKDLLLSIDAGVDMFDCIMPTRAARHGTIYTSTGKVNIKRSEYKADPSSLDKECGCYTCKNYSKAYLRHVFLNHEITSSRLNTIHNLYFYIHLMKRSRQAILDGDWDKFLHKQLTLLRSSSQIS